MNICLIEGWVSVIFFLPCFLSVNFNTVHECSLSDDVPDRIARKTNTQNCNQCLLNRSESEMYRRNTRLSTCTSSSEMTPLLTLTMIEWILKKCKSQLPKLKLIVKHVLVSNTCTYLLRHSRDFRTNSLLSWNMYICLVYIN